MPHRPPARCMFCNAIGVTKAHVFAKSWTSLFDEPNDTREHQVAHHYTNPSTGERHLMKRAKTFALWSRNVCGPCNSGWLNKLEERVKPLMAHFAADTPVVLGADEQADLALWASIATLVAMSNDPQAVNFADPELARTLYRTRRPTAGMDIWLGANSHGEMGWFRSHTLKIAHVPEKQGAWGATISFGYVVIHIICHDVPSQRMRLKGDAHRSMRRIWGTQDRVAWPSRLRWRPLDLSPIAIIVGEQSSFERAVPPKAA